MSFFKLILRNPFRVKSRAVLSIVGIAVGIMLIVALGGISGGLKAASEDALTIGGTDFMVFPTNMVADDGTPRKINSSYIDDIKNFNGVADLTVVTNYKFFPENSFAPELITGIDPKKIDYFKLKIIDGRIFNNNQSEAIVGKLYAESKNKSVGDTLTVGNEKFKITGIFESGNMQLDHSTATSLDKAQFLSKSSEVDNVYVKVDKGKDPEIVKKNFDKEFKKDNLTAISSIEDSEMFKQQLQMINTATWAISLLAVIVGAIGIVNTMIMSIFERIREIGVLKAVGWTKNRILLMIMGESIVLTTVSAIIGSLLAVIGMQLLTIYLGSGLEFTVKYSAELFVQAFAVAWVVGLVGGIYPAYKASKMPPTEALRYE